MSEGEKYQIKYYPTGEEIRIGDVIDLEWNGGRRRGRVIRHFLPEQMDPDAYNWGLSDGGILLDMFGIGLIAIDYVENELHFVARE